ncbi:alginate export family protein [Dyadobacter sp. CY356]|uniref:alginate export family protein n=1 Tax=Dyadobacter sp. CY356 TaxID=2906442 RepID=UPI001F39135C|nr:alginate export family protein [Dyadobacter sp. CY356]MCF0054763.1 alginate export family protein [Dyadobacter sp. CY356]
MKHILLLCFVLGSLGTSAQYVPLKMLRYDEDYSSLESDTTDNFYHDLKFSPLSKSRQTYISFGGDVRFQYYHVINDDWGEQPDKNYGYVFSRYLGHADFHSGNHFRAFLELQSGMANAKASTTPADENPLDLHQAFFDVSVLPGQKKNLVFRMGRQELSYGSQRLISVREGPNNRQAFDGIKAMVSQANYKTDLLYTHYVASKKGVFDDGYNKNIKLWGAYNVINKIPFLQNADVYYFGFDKKTNSYDDGKGKEMRHSIGTRIWGKDERWRYDLETIYQFGGFAGKSIRAWTASAHVDYVLDHLRFQPELGMKAEIISGDKRQGDDKLNTFNPLFPRGGYFGLAALIGPANLVDVHPSVNLNFTKKLSIDFDYDIFWRYSAQDGVYGPNAAMIYSSSEIAEKLIGHQYSMVTEYTTNAFLHFGCELTYFQTGKFLRQAGPGKNLLFLCLTAELKF